MKKPLLPNPWPDREVASHSEGKAHTNIILQSSRNGYALHTRRKRVEKMHDLRNIIDCLLLIVEKPESKRLLNELMIELSESP